MGMGPLGRGARTADQLQYYNSDQSQPSLKTVKILGHGIYRHHMGPV